MDWETLKVILAEESLSGLGPNPISFKVPTTVSPTSKVPEIISISKSFGTQYLVTSIPSKKAKTWVSGFNFLATNWMLRDLINGTISRLTTLSPTEVLSNCWVTALLVPDLVDVPVSRISRKLSWITLVVVVIVYPLEDLFVWVLVAVEFITSCPVQLSIQEFQIVGANPVCGSTFKVLTAFARVSA